MIQTNQVLFIEKLKVVPNSSILELHMQDVCNLIVYVYECRNHISISSHEQSFKRTKDFLRQRKALLWRQVFPMGRGEILLIATIRECIGMEFLGENAILEFNAVGLHWFQIFLAFSILSETLRRVKRGSYQI